MKIEDTIIHDISIETLKEITKLLQNSQGKKEIKRKKEEILQAVDKAKSKQKINQQVKKITRQKEKEYPTKKKKKTLSMNERLELATLSTFSLEDRKVLEKNNIRTMKDLREIEVSSLKGITEATKESISWAREFYNFDKNETKKLTK